MATSRTHVQTGGSFKYGQSRRPFFALLHFRRKISRRFHRNVFREERVSRIPASIAADNDDANDDDVYVESLLVHYEERYEGFSLGDDDYGGTNLKVK